MTDKEQIIIDGVNVSECEFYIYYSSDRYPHRCGIHKDMFGMPACCDVADCCKNCYFKQLQKEKFENLNNRQMVESAENLIYENSELYKNIKEKEQECERLKEDYAELEREGERLKSYGATLLADKNAMEIGRDDYMQRCKQLEQECEKLKKQLMQKSEVDMFFNTPIEGWSNDPCGICPHKAENEELKKEIINKNEKIKELRFSVSDLTNRLCYLNAEKSFRIVDLEQTLDEIEKELKEDIYCENQECGCDDFEECLRCTKDLILDIINKAKGEENE